MNNVMEWALAESKRTATINNSTMDSSEFWSFVNGGIGAAGVSVNEKTAMKVSAVYACVGLIGGAISCIPLPIYKTVKGEREKIDHEYHYLLNREANKDYSAAVFWQTLIESMLMHGDGFARILRPSNVSSRATGFEWYHKRDVEVFKKDGMIFYALTKEGVQEVVMADDMLHIPGLGFDGLTGMSQISYVLKNSTGIALAADEFSADFFANGAKPELALEYPGKVTPDQQDMIRNTWADRHQGASKRNLPALMTGGAKVHELTMNAEDAQLLTTRKFQVEDIARIFGVPPHMIGHTEKSSSWGTGVEQMSIGFVKYTLARHLRKIEQELNRKLFGRSDTFVEFNTAGLERGDYKTRMEGFRIALGRAGEPGWMTVNEIRKKENQASIAGGDVLNTGMSDEKQNTESDSSE